MESIPNADLSIIIVNWNTRELLKNCLDSIFSTSQGISLQIIVVDNHSTDGSDILVRTLYPTVHLIANNENLGFAKANNQAFPLCIADYVMLLNSDTVMQKGAFVAMLSFMHQHPDAGAIGPRIIHPHMRLRVLSCGCQPSITTLFNQYSGLSSLFPDSPRFRGVNLILGKHDDKVRQVEWISGACLMVRRKVIEQISGLDEEWFMYAEDMEWCNRMSRAGWKLFSVPEATVEHLMGASVDKNKSVTTMWIRSTRSYYIGLENPSRFKLLLFDSIMTFGLVSRAILYLLRGLIDKEHRAVWWTEARKFRIYASAVLTESCRFFT